MTGPRFDAEAFYVALDRVRRQRRMSWRDIRKESSVSGSTFTRMGLDWRPPSADNLVKLLAWLGQTDIAPYVTSEPREDGRVR